MAIIARPTKTGGNTTYQAEVAGGNNIILAAEVDADFASIYNDHNGNITNANISGSAAIATAKLAADGGLVNAHINAAAGIATTKLAADQGLTTAHLAPTAGTNGYASGNATENLAFNAETTVITADPISVRGGRTLIIANVSFYVFIPPAGETIDLLIRLRRDGGGFRSWKTRLGLTPGGAGAEIPFPFNAVVQDAQPAGVYVYSLTGEVLGAVGTNLLRTLNDFALVGQMYVLEFA